MMICDICGRYSPPDPETGYDAEDQCPSCAEAEDLADTEPERCPICGAVLTSPRDWPYCGDLMCSIDAERDSDDA